MLDPELEEPPPSSPSFPQRASIFALFTSMALVLSAAWEMRLQPPLATDALIYHLTLPASWLQNGLYTFRELPFHDAAADHQPMLFETLTYVLMSLTGDDALVRLVSPVTYIVLLFFYFNILSGLGLPDQFSFLLTGMMGLFSPFVACSLIVKNDLLLTASCAIAVYGLIKTCDQPLRGIILSCSGVALMMLTKYNGLLFGIPILLLLLVLVLLQKDDLNVRSAGFWCAAGTGGLLLLLGSSFFLRNWFQTGNPVFPARVQLFGITLFKGLYDPSIQIDHGWNPGRFYRLLINHKSRFGIKLPLSALLWLGYVLSWGRWWSGDQENKKTRRYALVLTCLPPLLILLHFLKNPFWNVPRLLFPIYFLLWVSTGGGLVFFLRSLSENDRNNSLITDHRLFYGLLGVHVLLLIRLNPFGSIVFWMMILPAVLFLFYQPLFEWVRTYFIRLLSGAALLSICLVLIYYPTLRKNQLETRYANSRQQYGEKGKAWQLIQQRTERYGSRNIAYAGTPIIYPLFGADLKNTVRYVPVHPDDQRRPIDPGKNENLYRQLSLARRQSFSFDHWKKNLQKHEIDLLYLSENPQGGTLQPERTMIRKHPEHFELLFRQEHTFIYQVDFSF